MLPFTFLKFFNIFQKQTTYCELLRKEYQKRAGLKIDALQNLCFVGVYTLYFFYFVKSCIRSIAMKIDLLGRSIYFFSKFFLIIVK